MRLELLPFEARAAHTDGTSWTVVAADHSARIYDEVLVTAGHGTWAAPAEPESWPHAAPLVPAVFPVSRWLTAERVPPGAVVVVRGFALTFLDAALALTEGRGGAFEAEDHPYRLRYVPGAADAGVIVPVSRTGRAMLAKPEPELAASVPELEEIARSGRERVLALPRGFDLRKDLLPILADTAAAALLAANRRRPEGERRRRVAEAAGRWLSRACDGFPPVAAHHAAAEVERSLEVGAGLRPPDLPWALGQTWQSLYPGLVARLGGAGLSHHEWPAFRRLAAEMERVAFGPPPVNAAKLLALVGAGRVDLDHAGGSPITTTRGVTSVGAGPARRMVDVVVNAVLPAPGVRGSGSALLAQLTADGHVRVAPRRRGLEITSDAACVGRDGRRTPGLSAIGRATEDWVIGNDTLNRSLHPHVDRWAQPDRRRVRPRAAAPGRRVSLRVPANPVASLRARCEGIVALPARLEPWQRELCSHPDLIQEWMRVHGSPVNLIDPRPMARNAAELEDAAAPFDLAFRVYFARKANKALALVDEARRLGLGIDLASERELAQVLAARGPRRGDDHDRGREADGAAGALPGLGHHRRARQPGRAEQGGRARGAHAPRRVGRCPPDAGPGAGSPAVPIRLRARRGDRRRRLMAGRREDRRRPLPPGRIRPGRPGRGDRTGTGSRRCSPAEGPPPPVRRHRRRDPDELHRRPRRVGALLARAPRCAAGPARAADVRQPRARPHRPPGRGRRQARRVPVPASPSPAVRGWPTCSRRGRHGQPAARSPTACATAGWSCVASRDGRFWTGAG